MSYADICAICTISPCDYAHRSCGFRQRTARLKHSRKRDRAKAPVRKAERKLKRIDTDQHIKDSLLLILTDLIAQKDRLRF